MIEAVAITDSPEAPLPSGLAQVRHEDLAGVFAPDADAHERASAEALWRHERLVEELMRHRAVLPLRYGTALAGERALEAALAERAREFEELLGLVRGRVELAVRVLDDAPPEEPAAEPRSGREYMNTLAARRKRVQDASALLEPLEAGAAATRRRESSGGDLTRWAFLVERDGVDKFKRQVDELRAANPELRVTCTGPWPPYTFATATR